MELHPGRGPVLLLTPGAPHSAPPVFQVELDIPTHVPPPARFAFGTIRTAAGIPVGRIAADEDTARVLAERIDGLNRPGRGWNYTDDDDEVYPAGEPPPFGR